MKRPGRGFDHLTPSGAKTTELHIYSPSGALVACSMVNFTFTLFKVYAYRFER